MEWYWVASGLLFLLVTFIIMGLPIGFALAAAAIPFLLLIQDLSTTMVTTELKLWGVWIDYILLAVPLFVFVGEIIARSNIGPNLYLFMHRKIPLKGAAAYGSINACAGFGAVCGSSMVGALTIGGIALPQMLKLGYSRRLSSGVLAAGGTLSVLIPPSLILLFYGIVTDQSIGELFIAGILPGIVLVSLFIIVIKIWALVYPQAIPNKEEGGDISWRVAFLALIPIIVIGLVITLSIYMGIATPTEASGVSSILTIILGFSMGGLTIDGFKEAVKATMRTMGFLGILLSSGVLFGFVMTYYRIPQEITQIFTVMQLSPYTVLFFVVVFYILLGMFLEPVSMTFITLPTLYPIIAASGFDLIWFGVIYTITMELAVLTPPVGLNLYVIQGLARFQVKIVDVIIGCLPFIGMLIVLLLLLTKWPEIALWLPSVM